MKARCLLALAPIACGLLPGVASAAQINPSIFDDIVANDGKCSLREAVTAANEDAPSGAAPGECPAGDSDATPDAIALAVGTYALTTPGLASELRFFHPASLSGAGAGLTTISQTQPGRTLRVFNAAGRLALSDVTVTGGVALPGAPGRRAR